MKFSAGTLLASSRDLGYRRRRSKETESPLASRSRWHAARRFPRFSVIRRSPAHTSLVEVSRRPIVLDSFRVDINVKASLKPSSRRRARYWPFLKHDIIWQHLVKSVMFLNQRANIVRHLNTPPYRRSRLPGRDPACANQSTPLQGQPADDRRLPIQTVATVCQKTPYSATADCMRELNAGVTISEPTMPKCMWLANRCLSRKLGPLLHQVFDTQLCRLAAW